MVKRATVINTGVVETTSGHNDLIAGDNVNATFDGADSLTQVHSTATTVGGNDDITAGNGDNLVIGGIDEDNITTGAGQDVVFGDNGQVVGNNNAALIDSTSILNGGDDTISSGAGNDIVIGGTADDIIDSGADNDLVFGDHAEVAGNIDHDQISVAGAQFTYTSTDTQNTDLGGDDVITAGSGDDIVLGQQGMDTIYGNAGDDDIYGGHNVALGQDTGDKIDAGSGDDVVIGDNGVITRTGDVVSTRFRMLSGTELYDANGEIQVDSVAQADPLAAEVRDITLYDHADDTDSSLFGSDVIAGGADD